MTSDAITTWLQPLQQIIDPTSVIDWSRLACLDGELTTLLKTYPIGPDLAPGPERSERLLLIRQGMAACGFHGSAGVFQLLAQFLCGYHDMDLRDTIGLGHGRLIAEHAPEHARDRWIRRLTRGELAGIAITEPHGGSRPAETQTYAVLASDGTWLISGRKTWISRLTEAAVFVVFFRAPDGRLAAAAVDSSSPGLQRQPIAPTGLAGWTWGVLDLDAVPVNPVQDVLLGDGMGLLRSHFAAYRPLVTATALGGAAAVFDTVVSVLGRRDLPRLRDSALVTLGRTYVQLVTALLGCVTAVQHAETCCPDAEIWSCSMKAHGIDTAHSVAGELALLLGAAGYRADSFVGKTCRDLGGLQYADGIHDSLYRTAGKHHVAQRPPMPTPRIARLSGDSAPVLT
jgi:alkylation response protein AidB-like acyl-CoA dehydrogenase